MGSHYHTAIGFKLGRWEHGFFCWSLHAKWASDGEGSGPWLQNCLLYLEAPDMGGWNGAEQPRTSFQMQQRVCLAKWLKPLPPWLKEPSMLQGSEKLQCSMILCSIAKQLYSAKFMSRQPLSHTHMHVNAFTLPIQVRGTVRDAQRFKMWKGMAPS